MSSSFFIALGFGLLQILYGWVARKKHQAKVFLYLGLVAGGLIVLGTVIFLLLNVESKRGLIAFNFFGWDMVGIATGIMLLVTGILWLVKRKFWPNGIFFCINLAFGVLWWLTRFYYSGT